MERRFFFFFQVNAALARAKDLLTSTLGKKPWGGD